MPHARAVSPCSPLFYTVPLSRPVSRLVSSYRMGGAFFSSHHLSSRLVSSRLVPRVVGRGVMSSRLVPRPVPVSYEAGRFSSPRSYLIVPVRGGVFFLSLCRPVIVPGHQGGGVLLVVVFVIVSLSSSPGQAVAGGREQDKGMSGGGGLFFVKQRGTAGSGILPLRRSFLCSHARRR